MITKRDKAALAASTCAVLNGNSTDPEVRMSARYYAGIFETLHTNSGYLSTATINDAVKRARLSLPGFAEIYDMAVAA